MDRAKNIILLRVFSTVLLILSLQSYSQVELELFEGGFTRPVAISHAGDSRLFIVEQAGKISIIDSSGSKQKGVFLDIRDRIKSTGNEQGLLGLAFHPDYKSNGYFYVNYTNLSGSTLISRFVRSADNPDIAAADSELIILSFPQPYSNHNGGDLKFGPDGYLYISSGDGGNRGDPQDRAQNPEELLGKMLRIDVDGGNPYAIPESNPFADSAGARAEIWAMGLRNPWRFSFDRATGDMWIADVGQGLWEEINLQAGDSKGGENYGWRCFEANVSYNSIDCPDDSNFVYPVYAYDHGPTGGCSVTGGFVYRGNDYPALTGYYFFTDYCTNRLLSLHQNNGSWVPSEYKEYPDEGFSTFGEDNSGELYIAGLNSGNVYRIKHSGDATGVSSDADPILNNNAGSGTNIYPNPVHNVLWIETDAWDPAGSGISIYNLQGELVYSSNIRGSIAELNLENLAAGIYFIEIGDGSGKEYRKILKY